jgi:hypothetical protein
MRWEDETMGRAERRRQERAAQKRETEMRRAAGVNARVWQDAKDLNMVGGLMVRQAAERQRVTRQLEAVRRIERNGITMAEMEEEFQRGRETGFKEAAEPILKSCYAGICLALHEEFGFGMKRCFRTIAKVDEKIKYALNHQELVDEVLEKTGLKIEMDDPFCRVQERD